MINEARDRIMETGDILFGKYRVERLLGKGGSGFVYLCTNIELGNKWALKYVPSAGSTVRYPAEVEILKKLYHVSLPRIVDVFSDEEGLYIVESNIEGTDLESLLRHHGGFEAERVVEWSLELCDILEYLHEFKPRPIIYRDLKPSNIMLTRGNRLVLIDFGISKEYSSFQPKDACIAGTELYAAPEQLIRGGLTDRRTDIYNLGATLYQLLHGRVQQTEGNSSVSGKDRAVSRLDRLIARCMENRPEDRYQSIEDIRPELLLVKNMLAVEGVKKRIIFRLEAALIVILSIISYSIAFLGIVDR